MSALTFRNRSGGVVEMPRYAATKAKNSFGKMLQTAFRQGAVAITRRDEPEAVLLPLDEYKALVAASNSSLNELSAEFDSVLEQMQTPKVRRGMKQAFDTSPSALGRAAVKHGRKRV